MGSQSLVEDTLCLRYLVDIPVELMDEHWDRQVRSSGEGMNQSYTLGVISIEMTFKALVQGRIKKERRADQGLNPRHCSSVS